MTHQDDADRTVSVPLRTWMDDEAKERVASRSRFLGRPDEVARWERESVVRKVTVAFGVAELLRHVRDHPAANQSPLSPGDSWGADDFAVRISPSEAGAGGSVSSRNSRVSSGAGSRCSMATVRSSEPAWKEVKGVEASRLPRQLSVNIVEPSFLDDGFGRGDDEQDMGRYLEAEFPSLPSADHVAAAVSQSEEDARCHSLGVLLYELFPHLSPLLDEGDNRLQEPASKRARSMDSKEDSNSTKQSYVPLTELGFPSSICMMLVKNLLDCGEDDRPDHAYDTLDTVVKDLHLLLLDPNRFLFDHAPKLENGRAKLSFRKRKLYGRENEVTSITDAFCRVSAGKSEAFFIGRFSGSGKSMLVDSLTARVDVAEGYVVTHKFDQMSKERPLFEVVSLFNELCLLIRDKSSQQNLRSMNDKLADAFGTDFSVLARLLPNVGALSPQFNGRTEKGDCDQTNSRSICFVLQRFVRVVSSASHPVMIFLDDLQWCDKSSLSLIEGILCDTIGSSCLFFVGSYRSNEVQDEDPIFPFMKRVESFGLRTTKLCLEGLSPKDLNTMISDALCMFPRICEPLSDVGNPFFFLEFLRSLVDRRLLEYNAQKRRWVWDEDCISVMDIAGNVLYLLSSKMNGLPDNIQLALKIAACFGIKMMVSVIKNMCTVDEYSSINDGMDQIVSEGFMIKAGTAHYQFVHDKVREAAYSLIPEDEKGKFHYKLGMALYSSIKGSGDMPDCIVFSACDQINRDIEDTVAQSPNVKMNLAELYENAGVKAMGCSNFATACKYLQNSLSLLPSDHWESMYDQSLRLTFMLANSAYSAGDADEAYRISQTIINHAHCLTEKLDAYHLIVAILHDREAVEEAYITSYNILLQLGEAIPDAFGPKEVYSEHKKTSKMLVGLSEESLMEMEQMAHEKQYILKFYRIITVASYSAKASLVPFFTCRMVQLTMEHGLSPYSIMAFVQYAAMMCSNVMVANIKAACGIAKLAMAARKRFGSSTGQVPILFPYYAFVAIYTEQVSINRLDWANKLCIHSEMAHVVLFLSSMSRSKRALKSLGEALSVAWQLAKYHVVRSTLTEFFFAKMNDHHSYKDNVGHWLPGGLNAIQDIRLSLIAGEKLPELLKRAEYYIDMMRRQCNTFTCTQLMLFRDTISILIGGGSSDVSEVQNDALKYAADMAFYHKAMRAYWIGHSERCHHFSERLFCGVDNSGGRQHRSFFMLYYGLNSFKVIRRTSPMKTKAVPHEALQEIKAAAKLSRWNFSNKAHLLEAEIFSREGRSEEAKASFAAAISSARSSRFVHEQGLACELAAYHSKKIGDHRGAWGLFSQARQCYTDWGSQVKVDSITQQLESFQISLAN
ncbi:hypothetical protein ACHAWF_011302 [Thalassiosira exigua]